MSDRNVRDTTRRLTIEDPLDIFVTAAVEFHKPLVDLSANFHVVVALDVDALWNC